MLGKRNKPSVSCKNDTTANTESYDVLNVYLYSEYAIFFCRRINVPASLHPVKIPHIEARLVFKSVCWSLYFPGGISK